MNKKQICITEETIETRIYSIRGKRVMLDRDLAELYRVETRRLKEQVRRNRDRFPADFMFELSPEELNIWRSQFATSKGTKKGLRHVPMAFTEQGVAMLSGVLNSKRAIQLNIRIMRAFVRLRQTIPLHKGFAEKLTEFEKKYDGKFEKHDKEIRIIFETIRQLMLPPEKPRRQIGFHEKDERGDDKKVKQTSEKERG
jgi:hypothetical protein